MKLANKISRNDFNSAMLDYYALLRSHDGIKANYIHAMGELRSRQLRDILKLQAVKELKSHYDIKDKLQKRFGSQWEIHIPAGYKLWNVLSGQFIEAAHSPQENILGFALDLSAKQLGLSDNVIQSLNEKLSDNSTSHLLVLPVELTNTLNKLASPVVRGPLAQVLKDITTGWKKIALYFPTRAFKYNARNLTGDLDPVIAANPHALTYVKQALSELWDAYFGDTTKISQELNEFQKRGGAITTETSQELGDFKRLKEFRHLIDNIDDTASWKDIPKKVWDTIDKFAWSGVIKATDFREQILRYASYLEYLHQMQNNLDGSPNNYGASVPDEVTSIPDIRDRAFKLANELLGAYDQVSETGKQLRDFLIPFYSWLEVNAKRYYQLIRNSLTLDNPSDFIAGFLKGQAIKSPLYAYRIGKTLFMVNLLSILVKAFNHFVWPDDENKLPPDIKERPHIILGHDPVTGDILYFDRIGAVADNLEWFRGDLFLPDIKNVLNGKLSVTEWIAKVCAAPFNKVIQGFNPFLKTPFELASGKSLFPDFTHPRNINDNLQYIAQSLGINWLYKAVKGTPHSNWDEFRNLFVYAADADEAAYFYALDLVRQFQERVLHKRSGGYSYTQRSNALQNLKRALRLDDKDSIKRHLLEYYSLGGNSKGLKSSLRNMNPLHSLSKKEQQQFLKWITNDDKKFLQRADNFFRSLVSRLSK